MAFNGRFVDTLSVMFANVQRLAIPGQGQRFLFERVSARRPTWVSGERQATVGAVSMDVGVPSGPSRVSRFHPGAPELDRGRSRGQGSRAATHEKAEVERDDSR